MWKRQAMNRQVLCVSLLAILLCGAACSAPHDKRPGPPGASPGLQIAEGLDGPGLPVVGHAQAARPGGGSAKGRRGGAVARPPRPPVSRGGRSKGASSRLPNGQVDRGAPSLSSAERHPVSPLPAVSRFADRGIAPTTLPPSEAERAQARQIGARLLARWQSGALVVTKPERETAQLQQLADSGFCLAPDGSPVALDPALLSTLDSLSARSTRERPLVILSLYRPLTPDRPRAPHGNGLAVDIAAFGGHRIDSRNVEECVAGVLAVIQALEPGRYRLGLPKPPDTDPVALLPPPPRPDDWPFFPAPLPLVDEATGVVLPTLENGAFVLNRRGEIRPIVLRWENERYAPLADVGSRRVRAAIEAAIARGAHIHSLFPDALDHLHLDVKPEP